MTIFRTNKKIVKLRTESRATASTYTIIVGMTTKKTGVLLENQKAKRVLLECACLSGPVVSSIADRDRKRWQGPRAKCVRLY